MCLRGWSPGSAARTLRLLHKDTSSCAPPRALDFQDGYCINMLEFHERTSLMHPWGRYCRGCASSQPAFEPATANACNTVSCTSSLRHYLISYCFGICMKTGAAADHQLHISRNLVYIKSTEQKSNVIPGSVQDIPRLEVPLHTLIELVPKPDGRMAEERIHFDLASETTTKVLTISHAPAATAAPAVLLAWSCQVDNNNKG